MPAPTTTRSWCSRSAAFEMSKGEPSRSRCAASNEPGWLPRNPSRPGGYIGAAPAPSAEPPAARAGPKSTPAAPATAIALPFMKSRRVIPVLIRPMFAIRLGLRKTAREVACQSGVLVVTARARCYALSKAVADEPGGSQITRPMAPPETVVRRLSRLYLRLGAVPGMVGRLGPGDLASDCPRRERRGTRGHHGRGAGTAVRLSHPARSDRAHLGARHDQRPRTVPPGARYGRKSQRRHVARRPCARNPDRPVAAGDPARGHGLRHGADDSSRYAHRRRSVRRFRDPAHRPGCPWRGSGNTRRRRAGGKTHLHRFAARQDLHHIVPK